MRLRGAALTTPGEEARDGGASPPAAPAASGGAGLAAPNETWVLDASGTTAASPGSAGLDGAGEAPDPRRASPFGPRSAADRPPRPRGTRGARRRARSTKPPPGSLLVAILGGVACGAVGLALYAILSASGSGASIDEALTAAFSSDWSAPPQGFVAAGFGLAGFFLVGALVRNRLVQRLFGAAGHVVALALALALGAAFGALAFVAYSTVMGDGAGAALEHLASASNDPGDPAAAFVLAGLLAGLVGVTFAFGRGAVRRGVRIATGAVVGGLAGLVIYSLAYVLLLHPELPRDSAYLLYFAQAVNSGTPTQMAFVGLAAAVGVLLSNYSWRLYGVVTFVSILFVVLGYILYTFTTTIPNVPPEERTLSYLLFSAELATLLMVLLYSFYTIDVAARKHWRRTTAGAPFSAYYLPKVAIHVPTFNEPFSLVRDTLESILRLDYPVDRFVLMVGDDSTDPNASTPLREFCHANGIPYTHRSDRRGYKAGALNVLLRETPADVDLIAVVDADYQVLPEFLRETVGYFVDPELGWLQTPQDYRNRHQSFLTEQYFLADAYFYRTILPSRNEQNSIIFCGTMGMLRRTAVEEVGGWGEKYITEDAELSVRLLNAGWNSLYINRTYGRGLIPPTFEAYKKQHYRWAFGGGRILRGHLGRFLFGRFTFRQRLDYLVGAVNWFEGAFILAISLFVLLLGFAELTGGQVVTHHSGEVLLVGLVPLFLLLDGVTRVHLVLRRSIHLTFGGTVRILGMWFSVKFSNTRAALKAIIGMSIPFVRTPKAPTERLTRMGAMARAVRLTPFESCMAMALLLVAAGVAARTLLEGDATGVVAGRTFMVFWLAYYATIYAAAPVYAYKSFASLKPGPEAVVRTTKDVNA